MELVFMLLGNPDQWWNLNSYQIFILCSYIVLCYIVLIPCLLMPVLPCHPSFMLLLVRPALPLQTRLGVMESWALSDTVIFQIKQPGITCMFTTRRNKWHLLTPLCSHSSPISQHSHASLFLRKELIPFLFLLINFTSPHVLYPAEENKCAQT